MRIVGPTLFLLTVLIAPTLAAEGPPAPGTNAAAPNSGPVADEVSRVKGLTTADQLRWTQEALQRFHRANLTLFQSAEVYRRYDWAKKMADEIVRDGPQKDVAVAYLVQELTKAETAAFEELRREFKRTVLTSLDSDADEQKRRLEAWDQLFDQWQVAGGTDRDRAELIQWLRKAIQNQRLGAGPLPPFPELGEKPDQEENLLGGFDLMRMGTQPQGEGDVDWPKWKIEQMVSITRKPMEKPPASPDLDRRLMAVPRASSVPQDALGRLVDGPATREAIREPVPRAIRAPIDRLPTFLFSASPLPRTRQLWALAEAPRPRAAAPSETADSKLSSPETPDVATGRVAVARDGTFTPPNRPRPDSLQPESIKPRVAEVTPKQPRPQLTGTPPAGNRVPRTNQFPAAPPTEKAEPLPPETGQPVEPPAATSIASRIETPPSPFANVEPTPVKKSPSVNLQRLNTLVRGYNLAVQELETKLDAPRDWNARNLTPVVAQLRDLTQRERDLRIFEQVVSEDERQYMESIAGLSPIVSRIAAAIYEARGRAMRRDNAGSSRIRAREIEDLQDLSQQLARLAAGP